MSNLGSIDFRGISRDNSSIGISNLASIWISSRVSAGTTAPLGWVTRTWAELTAKAAARTKNFMLNVRSVCASVQTKLSETRGPRVVGRLAPQRLGSGHL